MASGNGPHVVTRPRDSRGRNFNHDSRLASGYAGAATCVASLLDVFAGTAFFDRTYQEALGLLRESRDYLAYCQDRDIRPLEPFDRLRFTLESTRLTARLTDIMAWLFVQKAVAEGELSVDEAAGERYRLLRGDAVLDPGAVGDEILPRGLVSLLARSHLLYLRIVRLEEMVARGTA